MTAAATLAGGSTHPARGAQEVARATLVAVRRASRDVAGDPAGVWWARLAERGPSSPEHSLVAVGSERFPDGTPVDLTSLPSRGRRPAGWLVDVRYRRTDGTVVHVEPAEALAGRCPPLWFAEVHHATSGVPAVSLLAFRGTEFRPGSLVGPHEVAARGTRMTDRVGEVRWWTRSGVVDTVTVAPELRGRGIGRVLVTVAEALRVLRGWAPLRSDGRLTDAGAAWLAAAPPSWAPRLARRTERLPDEPAAAEPTGVARLFR
ncbi:hypothetical protein [Geodermatophilus sp. CPCC 206100]|uniref:hypothetical protein n=1 Tax=Geodermatophilus sp. CPCC 206100 TaxID=3020054 RepID=UPI003AFFAFBE